MYFYLEKFLEKSGVWNKYLHNEQKLYKATISTVLYFFLFNIIVGQLQVPCVNLNSRIIFLGTFRKKIAINYKKIKNIDRSKIKFCDMLSKGYFKKIILKEV